MAEFTQRSLSSLKAQRNRLAGLVSLWEDTFILREDVSRGLEIARSLEAAGRVAEANLIRKDLFLSLEVKLHPFRNKIERIDAHIQSFPIA